MTLELLTVILAMLVLVLAHLVGYLILLLTATQKSMEAILNLQDRQDIIDQRMSQMIDFWNSISIRQAKPGDK